jgi:hypothetical protein
MELSPYPGRRTFSNYHQIIFACVGLEIQQGGCVEGIRFTLQVWSIISQPPIPFPVAISPRAISFVCEWADRMLCTAIIGCAMDRLSDISGCGRFPVQSPSIPDT